MRTPRTASRAIELPPAPALASHRTSSQAPATGPSPALAVLLLGIAAACGSSPAAPSREQAGVVVPVGPDGEVLATVTASGPGGAALTLHPGTIIVRSDGSRPGPADVLRIAVEAGAATQPALPAELTALAHVKASLTVNGTPWEAAFATSAGAAELPLPERLAHRSGAVLAFATGAATDGALTRLYRATASGPSYVGASVAGAATGALPIAAAGAAAETRFDAPGTGDYGAGLQGAAAASAPPAGAFWSTFTIAAPGCAAGGATGCGDHVGWVTVGEPSTAELLGLCLFDPPGAASTDVATFVHPDGSRFWCERSQAAAGGATTVKVSSLQANLPYLHAVIVRADGVPFSDAYVLQPADGLHGPGGAVYADPYTNTGFEFAGAKELHFTSAVAGDWSFAATKGRQPLLAAGYDVWSWAFQALRPRGFHAVGRVGPTRDGRARIEQAVILADPVWTADPARTRGNKGTYTYTPRLELTALPITLTEIPRWSETNVAGLVMVMRAGDPVTDAVVTVNGQPATHLSGALYDVAGATAAAGDTLTIQATTTDPPQTRTLTIPCPPVLTFTAPAAGSTVASSAALAVTWAPSVPFDVTPGGQPPMAGEVACYIDKALTTLSRWGHGDWFVPLTSGATGASIPLDACAGHLVELQYPGALVSVAAEGAYDTGQCLVRHRMWLYGP